jgi:hypothetical protein
MHTLSKQQIAQAKALFKAVADADSTISADALTAIVQDVTQRDSLSAKTVRAHLRKTKARDQSKYKQANWRIVEELMLKTVTAFNRKSVES